MLNIPLGDIFRDPDFQVRHTSSTADKDGALDGDRQKKSLQLLVDDLRANGQLIPVCIFPKKGAEGQPFTLIDGHRRYAALEQMESPTIKAVVVKADEKEALRQAFTLNNCRKDLSPIDLMNAILLARKKGWKRKDIEKAFGLKRTQIQRYEYLLDCPEGVRAALASKKISMAQALAILDVTRNRQEEVSEVLSIVMENGLSGNKIHRQYGKPKGGKPKSRKSLISGNGEKRLVRKFSFSKADSPDHLAWLKKELEKVLAEIESLKSKKE
ncbi:MAG: ParB/RepB/Spo0J family partition protein [Planctomycetes bacterium]|nr:ParB/RepB/Spo0J family partition protein [Planctomycetota bacterium]